MEAIHLQYDSYYYDLPHDAGTIGDAFGSLPDLQTLVISGTYLHGTLPADLGQLLPNLQHLDLSANQLRSSIPSGESSRAALACSWHARFDIWHTTAC